jgi:hypothetical protein
VHKALITRLTALSCIPAAIFIIGLQLQQLIRPYFAGLTLLDYDPSYIYLLNGAGMLHGFVPGHVDHPGTPLQLLTGGIALLCWLSGGATARFSHSIISSPEYYLAAISNSLLSLNSLALLYLGRAIFKSSGSLLLAIAIQGGLLTLGSLFPRLGYVAPEALISFAALMMLAELCPVLFADNSARTSLSAAVRVGSFAGLGITSKVTFLPLLLLLLFLPGRRPKLMAAIASVLFSGAMLLLIWPRIGKMLDFFATLATHQGRYGTGEFGLIKWDDAAANLAELLKLAPQTFLVLAICILLVGVAFLCRRSRPTCFIPTFFGAALFLSIAALQIAMVVRHFHPRYFFPLVVITPVILGWCIFRIQQTGGNSYQLMRVALVVIASANCLVGGFQLFALTNYYKSLSIKRDQEISAMNAILARYPNAIVISTYRAREINYALQLTAHFSTFAEALISKTDQRWSYERYGSHIIEAGKGVTTICQVQRQMGSSRELLFVLPPDVTIPGLVGDTLMSIRYGERIVMAVFPAPNC